MPPPRPTQIPPRQARSRETLRRMLDAVEIVLDKHGLEGATLPRIAAQAGLSPAAVYRRFRDKDALIRAVFVRASQMRTENLAKPIDAGQLRQIGLRNVARNWIAAMIHAFRTRTGFLRATALYSHQHSRAPFVRRQRKLEIQGFHRLVETFLLWRDEIRHPDPAKAVSYAVLMTVFALRELILFDQASTFQELMPLSDDQLQSELTMFFLRYLGVDSEASA